MASSRASQGSIVRFEGYENKMFVGEDIAEQANKRRSNEHCRRNPTKFLVGDGCMDHCDKRNDDSDRKRMAHSNGGRALHTADR